MFGTDSYKTGFEQGVQDATSNQGKRLLPDLKTFFQSLFHGGDHLMSEYHNGYEQGYTKGLEKANGIYKEQREAPSSQNQEESNAKDSEKAKGSYETRQTTPNSQTQTAKNETIMANSFGQQIVILEGLKAKLRDVQNYLEGISSNYVAKVAGLEGEGFLRGVPYTALEDNLADTKSQISKLIDHIEHGDIAAIDKWIAELERLA